MSSIETSNINNLSQVKHIDGKTRATKRSSSEPRRGRKSKNESFQDPLSRPHYKRGENMYKISKSSSFQDHQPNSFQDHLKRQTNANTQNKLISRPSFKTLDRTNGTNGQQSSFQYPLSRPLIQSITEWVKKLNSKYYTPPNEQTKVISDPVKATKDQPWEESTVAPHPASTQYT